MMKRNFFYGCLLLLAGILTGCTEQYALQSETFEDALVVEATITNELKEQEIKITRTYRLEDLGPTTETGANVYVTDDIGNQYDFVENGGKYVSTVPFAAEPSRIYRMNITTSQGKNYTSDSQKLTTVTPMQSVEAKVTSKDGQRGAGIIINTYDPTNTSKYYRYEYEETFKVIAPKWDDERAMVVYDGTTPGIVIIPRVGESQTCYTTQVSDRIIQVSTNDLNEDRVNYRVRFISNRDYIITHRYSILVRQYVQSLAAYTFYKTLNELSGDGGSVLSQNQPGFFYGNIKCVENPNEKVIGFFEVASVSSQRIFFNYADLFPGEQLPPYFINCEERIYKFCFNFEDPECKGSALISAISSNTLLYLDDSGLTYLLVPPPCGDCSLFSNNVKPSFWID